MNSATLAYYRLLRGLVSGKRILDFRAEESLGTALLREAGNQVHQGRRQELPEAYVQRPYRLEIGFFDEADSAHHYPPLRVTGGGNSVCVPPSTAVANLMCRLGSGELSGHR